MKLRSRLRWPSSVLGEAVAGAAAGFTGWLIANALFALIFESPTTVTDLIGPIGDGALFAGLIFIFALVMSRRRS